jgi:hypothetical protein
MDSKNLDEYKKLYSQFVENIANLHNYHEQFLLFYSIPTGEGERRQIRQMIKIGRELLVLSKAITQEANLLRRQEKEKKRAENTARAKSSGRRARKAKKFRTDQRLDRAGKPESLIKYK